MAGLLATRAERAVHLEADAFFRFIRSGHVEPWKPESHDQNAMVMRIVARAAAGYASAGYLTIIDGVIIPGRFFEPLRDALRDEGYAVSLAVLSGRRCQSARAVSRAAKASRPSMPVRLSSSGGVSPISETWSGTCSMWMEWMPRRFPRCSPSVFRAGCCVHRLPGR